MKCLGGNPGMDWHPIGGGEGGGSKTPSCFNAKETQIKSGQHGLSTDFDSHTKLCLLLK